jgi:transcriptional regulator with XRE-family HTH domain
MTAAMLPDVTRSISPTDKIPAARLVAALAATSTSQSELARRMGSAAGTINRYCNDKLDISPRTWLAISQALGLPADWQPTPPPPTTH